MVVCDGLMSWFVVVLWWFIVVHGGLMSWFVVVCSVSWWFNVMVCGGS